MALQINEGKLYESTVLFLGEGFVRVTEEENGKMLNSYYDWKGIQSIRTYGPKEEQEKKS